MINSTKHYCYIYYDPRTDQPFLVGKGSGVRAFAHLTEQYHETKNFHKWAKIRNVQNAGLKPIIRLMYTDTEQEAYALEEFFTHHWGIESEGGILTNMIHGGRGGWARVPKSEKHKHKIGEGNKRASQDPQTFKRKSDAAKGNVNGQGNKGIPKSEQSKLRMSISKKKFLAEHPEKHPMLGKHHSDETKEKIASKRRGVKQSEQHIQLRIQALIGGKRAEETKKKMSESAALDWIITFPDGHVETISNLYKFCRQHSISDGNLITYGHTKGYRCRKAVSPANEVIQN